MEQSLLFVVKLFPPSSNHIYVNNSRGGRFKTKEAEAFEHRFIQAVHTHLPAIQRFFADRKPEDIYSVSYLYYFPHDDIVCKTFGQGKKGSAESRYKKIDAENRTKLVSDSLAKALGIDDNLFFSVRVDKRSARQVQDESQIWVYVQKTDPTFFGV